MTNPGFIGGTIGYIFVIELILRVITYIAVIGVSYKAIQALNTYINKNSK